MRQLRRVFLASKHGVRRARRAPRELAARHSAYPGSDAGFLEDRLRELGPGAVTVRSHVPDAERPGEHFARGLGEMAGVRRRRALVVDDGDLALLATEA